MALPFSRRGKACCTSTAHLRGRARHLEIRLHSTQRVVVRDLLAQPDQRATQVQPGVQVPRVVPVLRGEQVQQETQAQPETPAQQELRGVLDLLGLQEQQETMVRLDQQDQQVLREGQEQLVALGRLVQPEQQERTQQCPALRGQQDRQVQPGPRVRRVQLEGRGRPVGLVRRELQVVQALALPPSRPSALSSQ